MQPGINQGDKSGLESLFTAIEDQTEQLAKPTGADAVEVEWLAREERWKQKRIGKITASKLPDLMKAGRKKEVLWGDTAINVLLAVAHERRTGVERSSIKGVKAIEWGKQYEAEALEFYRKKTGTIMRSASSDFDEILFFEPFDGFGDSPDGVTDDFVGRAEIKCPENGAVHYEYTTIKSIAEGDDYYEQILGHMLDPRAEWCDFISYDPRSADDDPLKMHIVRVWKKDHAFNIAKLQERINKGNKIVDLALEKNDISIIMNINNL